MTAQSLDQFIELWKNSAAAERANYMLFLSQLCDQLGVPQPQPTQADVAANAYVFERDVKFDQGDGTSTTGRIDLYKRSCFVLSAQAIQNAIGYNGCHSVGLNKTGQNLIESWAKKRSLPRKIRSHSGSPKPTA